MDPQTDLPDLVEDLEVNIDELTTTLTPLLPPNALAKTATSLPLLEKAKLHVLAAYAIESVLFSTLQASGADAKAHPLFAELARLKGYFAKISDAETHFARLAEKEKRARLDVGAAQRFIRHGLSGNERYDELRKEKVAREKERALEKARQMTNRKFDEATPRKRSVEDGDGTPGKKARVGSAEGDEQGNESGVDVEAHDIDEAHVDVDEAPDVEEAQNQSPAAAEDAAAEDAAAAPPSAPSVDAPAPAKKKRGRPSRKDKTAPPQNDTPTRATRSSAPKTRSEAFQALASASPASAAKAKGKGKGKGREK